MDSIQPLNQPDGDSNNAETGGRFNSSSSSSPVSYFQKTICLQDWWLIKVDMNGEGKRLGVAGFTSREQHALRLFSSAPITKRYSMFTLETMDGLCVILNGLINKSRTLENGFSSEVFTHFVIGFPPYWEQYAEGFFRRGSAADVISREDADKKNLTRESPETPNKTFGESRHIESENLNTGADDHLDMMPGTGQHGTPFNESSEPIFTFGSALNDKDSRNSKNLVEDVIVDQTSIEYAPLETSIVKGNSLIVDGSIFFNFSAGITENDPTPVEHSRSLDLSGHLLDDERVDNTENSPIVKNSKTSLDDSMTQQVSSELERNVASTNINVDANVIIETSERNNIQFENLISSQKDSDYFGATIRKTRTRSSTVNDSFWNSEKEKEKEKETENRKDKSKRKQVDQAVNVDADVASKTRCSKGGTLKKVRKTGRSTSKRGISEKRNRSINAVKGKDKVVKDTSASGKKTKKKLTYESPVKQGKEEEESIVPIESLSYKRSRSGRILLPSLEFWRNQTLVYDANGQIAGIKEVPYTVQPCRGSKSEPPKKKSKRLV